MFFTAPAGLSAGAYAGHQESTAVHSVLAQKPPGGGHLFPLRAYKVRSGGAVDRRPPARGHDVTTGGYPASKGTDPEKRTDSGTKVSRYGHLRFAPVVVYGVLRFEWEPPKLRAAFCSLHSPDMATPRCFFFLPVHDSHRR